MKKIIFIFLILFSFSLAENPAKPIDVQIKPSKKTVEDDGFLFQVKNCFYLFLKGGSITLKDKKNYIFDNIDGLDGNCNYDITDGFISFRISYDNHKNFDLKIKTSNLDPKSEFWSIDHISLLFDQKNVSINVNYLNAPFNYSFSCNDLELFPSVLHKDENKTEVDKINLKRFQIQPFGGQIFFDNYDCSSWFSLGTAMGLIAFIILTNVFAFGIIILINIKPNDRFEDPKKKSLAIGLVD